ncbi:hypothetical protein ACFQ3Z_29520 [Streptomyces nogalater]
MVMLLQERSEYEVLENGPLSEIHVAGRSLVPTVVFDTYWRFAAARQKVYEARLAGGEDLSPTIRSCSATASPTVSGLLTGSART